MKINFVFFLLLANLQQIRNLKINLNSSNHSKLASATSKIINGLFASRSSTSTLISANISIIKDFKDELFAKTFSEYKIAFRQESPNTINAMNGRRRKSNIFLVYDFKDFKEIYGILVQRFQRCFDQRKDQECSRHFGSLLDQTNLQCKCNI